YLTGKFFSFKKEFLAPLLIYIIAPVVIFAGVVSTQLNISMLSIPVLFFVLCSIASLTIYYLAGFIWKDSTKNILAFSAGTANTGYFGLPVAVALFGHNAIPIVALALLGTSLYTNSFGFFLAAKGQHTTKESFTKVLQLPILYAFFLGILVNMLHIHMWPVYFSVISIFNQAFTVLGMMLVGIALADITIYKFDIKFITLSLLTKFFFWPFCMICILLVDSYTYKIYDASLYPVFILLSIIPVAVNIVSYATILKTHPEKVSLTVFISTLFALFYIPIVAALFLK